jgi:hypothetical protein
MRAGADSGDIGGQNAEKFAAVVLGEERPARSGQGSE